MQQMFDLGDVLTAATGTLLSENGIEGAYKVCSFLAGEPVMTHQLGRVLQEARPSVLRQHPALKDFDGSGITPENFKERMAAWKRQYGERLALEPLTEDEHERIDPISELAEKMHPDRIRVVLKD